jgi:cell division transport system ATP-binding protein
MIVLERVSKVYGPDSVGLDDISLHIPSGEFVSIVGQSGAGKTTLAKLLMAEEQPTAGRIEIGGWDITKINAREIPELRRQIGVIFQDYKLLPKKTVYENVAFALEVAGVKSKLIKEIVPQVLHIVGLDEKMNRFPQQLSGGEQQRVVIARSLVHRPKVLFPRTPTVIRRGKDFLDLEIVRQAGVEDVRHDAAANPLHSGERNVQSVAVDEKPRVFLPDRGPRMPQVVQRR